MREPDASSVRQNKDEKEGKSFERHFLFNHCGEVVAYNSYCIFSSDDEVGSSIKRKIASSA
ncbi:hypothetical protein CGI00_15540 [Vibrio parahaemolyticus]|nr:hypothetical protein CGI00_15540 [Vibrio parahaemolyticus]TOL45827.1 hypothetical protein CGH97_21930 [Vibrio parahaemolyticus]